MYTHNKYLTRVKLLVFETCYFTLFIIFIVYFKLNGQVYIKHKMKKRDPQFLYCCDRLNDSGLFKTPIDEMLLIKKSKRNTRLFIKTNNQKINCLYKNRILH